jgi:hypothetical protein
MRHFWHHVLEALITLAIAIVIICAVVGGITIAKFFTQ